MNTVKVTHLMPLTLIAIFFDHQSIHRPLQDFKSFLVLIAHQNKIQRLVYINIYIDYYSDLRISTQILLRTQFDTEGNLCVANTGTTVKPLI